MKRAIIYVVILTAVVVWAMFFPTHSKVLPSALLQRDANLVRSIGVSLRQYSDEHEGALPDKLSQCLAAKERNQLARNLALWQVSLYYFPKVGKGAAGQILLAAGSEQGTTLYFDDGTWQHIGGATDAGCVFIVGPLGKSAESISNGQLPKN
jgi:hypothetical protein